MDNIKYNPYKIMPMPMDMGVRGSEQNENEAIEPRISINYIPHRSENKELPKGAVVKSHEISINVEELDDESYLVERRESFEYELNGAYGYITNATKMHSATQPNEVYLKAFNRASS